MRQKGHLSFAGTVDTSLHWHSLCRLSAVGPPDRDICKEGAGGREGAELGEALALCVRRSRCCVFWQLPCQGRGWPFSSHTLPRWRRCHRGGGGDGGPCWWCVQSLPRGVAVGDKGVKVVEAPACTSSPPGLGLQGQGGQPRRQTGWLVTPAVHRRRPRGAHVLHRGGTVVGGRYGHRPPAASCPPPEGEFVSTPARAGTDGGGRRVAQRR